MQQCNLDPKQNAEVSCKVDKAWLSNGIKRLIYSKVAMAAGPRHSVVLMSDSMMRSVDDNKNGQCDVSDWHGICGGCSMRLAYHWS